MVIYATCSYEENSFFYSEYDIDDYFRNKEDALNAIKHAEKDYRYVTNVEHYDDETVVTCGETKYHHYVKEIKVH